MKDGHGGVVLGSECSGNIRNVFTEDCVMDSPNLDRALRIKTNSFRGGIIENIFMRNVQIGQVREAVLKINFYYEKGDTGKFTPMVRNVYMEQVTCEKSRYAIWIKGYKRSPITNIVLKDCEFNGIDKENILKYVDKFEVKNVYMNGKKQ